MQPSVKNAIITCIMVVAWKLEGGEIGLHFKRIPAASVQTTTVPHVKPTIIISVVFVYVSPASVVTARSVQRWWSAKIVTTCVVWVARI